MSVRWFHGKDPLGKRRPTKRVTPVPPISPNPKPKTRNVKPRTPGVVKPRVNVPFTYSSGCGCPMCKTAGGPGSGDIALPTDTSDAALHQVFRMAHDNGYVVDEIKWLRHGSELNCPVLGGQPTPICEYLEYEWNQGSSPTSLAEIYSWMKIGQEPYNWSHAGIYAISHPGCNCGISIRFVDGETGTVSARADIYATAADIPGFEMVSPADGMGIDSPEDSSLDFAPGPSRRKVDFSSSFIGGDIGEMPGTVHVPIPGASSEPEEGAF